MKPKTIKQKLLLLGILAGQGLGLEAATHTVDIINFGYTPATLRVKVGDTVTWVQKDTTEHTSTSGTNGDHDGIWDSGSLRRNQTFSYTFNQAGNFPYYCAPHPFMTATIIAEADQATPPTVSITLPENNTTYPRTTNLTISATASVTGSTISHVEFFRDGTSIGMDHDQPYETASTFGAGTYQLTARAVAANGATTTSTPVTITVQAGGDRIDDPFPERLSKTDLAIELQIVATNLISPLGMAAPRDGTQRLFVYDQAGLVYVIQDGALLATPMLDVRNRLVPLRNYDERGLLGMAVHPNFQEKPFIYTYTSEPTGPMADFMIMPPEGKTNNHQSVITEWRIDSANSNLVDVASRREVLRIDQPQSNHNGGTMRFGHDGLLYVTLGDGGAADDQGDGHPPIGNGQDITTILGSVIRIDVDGRTSMNGQYGVPLDNPFVNIAGVDEIYAYGFRNPFSFSFDHQTGELYLADVGQNEVEELDLVFKGGNYGWPIKEGSFYFDPNGSSAGFISTMPVTTVPADLIDPVAEYDHDEGLAIVGGYVYRGSKIPALAGRYVTGDWGSFSTPTGRLFVKEGRTFKELQIGYDNRPLDLWLKGFGEDQAGELYVFGSTNLGPNGTSGIILKVVPLENNLNITGINRDGTNINISWTGGVGPFVLETKTDVADLLWKTHTATTNQTVSLPMEESAAFFRVSDVAGNAAIGLSVSLSGASERPDPTTSSGTGSGILRLEGNTLTFDISYAGLSAAANAAHIHGPANASESTNVLINLAPFVGPGGLGVSGTFSGSVTLTPQQKAIILAGKSYVNIHTANHQPGEIRGQILPVVFAADLSGAAERPAPMATRARGSGSFLLAGNELTFNINYWDLTSFVIGAHIHGPATSTNTADVLIDLAPFNDGFLGTNGTLSGRVILNTQQLAYLADGLLYVNIHTPWSTVGEIRGQILPAVTAVPYTASLSGAAEVPAVSTEGNGSAILMVQGSTLSLNATYKGFQSNARMAHIHGPATSTNTASVLLDLAPLHRGSFGTNGIFSGSIQLAETNAYHLRSNMAYLNVHSVDHGQGEIRGQVAPVLYRTDLLGASERNSAVHTAGSGTAHLLLVGNRLYLNATYGHLSSPAFAAHIHGPASTPGTATVMVDLGPLHQGPFEAFGSFAGFRDLTPVQLGHIVDERTYINVHSDSNNAGELRGQIRQ